eukprot:gb/GECG01000160.1/.p1 GENE.gb/GECG01000160.1/~~gb/GECG01000160.1/.p1  ORF type:complete len:201 (+),score=44.67 gb/GECG01000160.1/:1-603(+)
MAHDDPFEQFMAEIEEVTKQQQETHQEDTPSFGSNASANANAAQTPVHTKQKQLYRDLDEEYTAGEGFDRERDANAELIRFRRMQGQQSNEDSDADVRLAAKKAAKSSNRFSEEDAEDASSLSGHSEFLLPPVDHSKIDYEPFRKCFYNVSEAIKNLSAADVALRRRQHNIEIVGPKVPHMISEFLQSGLDKVSVLGWQL